MKLELTNGNYEVYERGEVSARPTLLFLHYFAGSSRAWYEVIAQLENSNYCLALDLRGFGASVSFNDAYAVEDYASDVTELAQKLNLTRYILVGHSMGGKVALAVAARQPKELEALLLCAPSPPSPEPMTEAERRRLLSTHGSRAAALETIQKIVAHPLPAPLLERAVEDNLRSGARAWQAWLEQGSRADISGLMKQITVPVKVVVGAADPVISPALLKSALLGQLASSSLEIIADAGHLLPLEVPEKLASFIQTKL